MSRKYSLSFAFFLSSITAAPLFSACGGQVDSPTHDPNAPPGTTGTAASTPSDGNGICCPPSALGCCMSFGGWMPAGTCPSFDACDNLPDFSDPGWHKAKDEHGCEQWVAPWSAQRICNGMPPAHDAGHD